MYAPLKKPHFVIIPFLSQGHMIPLIDVSKLLSKRGVIITILTTPQNANRFEKVVQRANDSGHIIRVVHLQFPSTEVGLPDGCENCDMLPSFSDMKKFLKGISMLKNQVQEMLPQFEPLPNCLIADTLYSWAADVARNSGIPKITFAVTSCFSLLCSHLLRISKEFRDLDSNLEYFVVPCLPDRIEFTKVQYWGSPVKLDSDYSKVWDEIEMAKAESFGIIANTVEDLEAEYVKEYRKVIGGKFWCVGPVSLCNVDESDKAERGKKAAVDESQCLEWLDLQDQGSVIYVCLGSLTRLPVSSMKELGLALEGSNRPFVWVIGQESDGFKEWLLEEELEERMKGKGFFIRGWAPQIFILSHPSVGGFLTHCGWNSTLEGITAGVPMITWPCFSDHFYGEKFIVDVLKIGIRAGVELPVCGVDEENYGVFVKSENIMRAIERLMDGGEEGEERRKRARKFGEIVRRAPEEGGSSYLNVTLLIQDVMSYQENKD